MKRLMMLSIMLLSGASFCMETFDPIESKKRAIDERTYILGQVNDFFRKTVEHHKGAATINQVSQSPASLANDLIAYFVLPNKNVEIRAEQIRQRAGLPIAKPIVDSAADLTQIIDTFFTELKSKKDRAAHYSDFIPAYSIIIAGTGQTPVRDAELIAIYPNPAFRPDLMGSSRFKQVYIKPSGNL